MPILIKIKYSTLLAIKDIFIKKKTYNGLIAIKSNNKTNYFKIKKMINLDIITNNYYARFL